MLDKHWVLRILTGGQRNSRSFLRSPLTRFARYSPLYSSQLTLPIVSVATGLLAEEMGPAPPSEIITSEPTIWLLQELEVKRLGGVCYDALRWSGRDG